MRYASLPLQQLLIWARLNDVHLNGVETRSHIVGKDGMDKGGGLVATQDHEASSLLLTVPRELVLNKASIENAIRADKYLREVLEAVVPTLTETPRTMIMIFLLLQLTRVSPDTEKKSVGSASPLTDYVKFLPQKIALPTLYNTDERELLAGTSLENLLVQKLERLDLEFEHLRSSTQHIKWCQELWWDDDTGLISIEEWRLVDAMYRSRAVGLPQNVGDSMVPIMDMANHDYSYNARFEPDADGNVQLIVRDGWSIKSGEEVTIIYGCGGASEMVFSYGFLDRNADNAREIFLDLKIPDDDPLKRAKIEFAKEAPCVRIFTDQQGQIGWESSFVWWACINEEDGLGFRAAQRTDGSVELEAIWKNTSLQADTLKQMLMMDSHWDVFLLRAIVLIQSRVEMQGIELSLAQEKFEALARNGNTDPTTDTLTRLRDLEMELIASTYQMLESEKARLMESDAVRTFLNQSGPDRSDGIDDDFS